MRNNSAISIGSANHSSRVGITHKFNVSIVFWLFLYYLPTKVQLNVTTMFMGDYCFSIYHTQFDADKLWPRPELITGSVAGQECAPHTHTQTVIIRNILFAGPY